MHLERLRVEESCSKSRARVYFVKQILALLLVSHQTHNLAHNKFARALANQPIRALHFFDLQQMSLLRIKFIMQGEKRETSTKTCNETMLRDKLRVFVSRISPPLLSPRATRTLLSYSPNFPRAFITQFSVYHTSEQCFSWALIGQLGGNWPVLFTS